MSSGKKGVAFKPSDEGRLTLETSAVGSLCDGQVTLRTLLTEPNCEGNIALYVADIAKTALFSRKCCREYRHCSEGNMMA